jgi:16S rRNA C1402 (ribose-2'-O) methylase RsmI
LKLGIYVNRPIIVFRELTKAHEERLEGTIESIVQRITPPIGEFTVVIPRMTEDASARVPVSSDEILSVFGEITKNKAFASRRQAARAVAQRLGVSVREVYETIKTVELLPKDA